MLKLPPIPVWADLIAGWPDWLAAGVGATVAVFAVWILIRVIKLALWLALIALVVAGAMMAVGLWLR